MQVLSLDSSCAIRVRGTKLQELAFGGQQASTQKRRGIMSSSFPGPSSGSDASIATPWRCVSTSIGRSCALRSWTGEMNPLAAIRARVWFLR
jgi:hypothetical protein